MNNKQIAKYLIKNLGLNLLINIVISNVTIYIFWHNKLGNIEGNSGYLIISLAILCFNLIFTFLSLTVFFNLDEAIRHNKYYRFLSFYFLPIAFYAYFAFENKMAWNEITFQMLPIILQTFLLHSWYYYKFCKMVIKENN